MNVIDTFTAGDIAALRGDEQWTADVLATARCGLRIRIRPHHQPDAPYWVDAVTLVNLTTRAHFDRFRAADDAETETVYVTVQAEVAVTLPRGMDRDYACTAARAHLRGEQLTYTRTHAVRTDVSGLSVTEVPQMVDK